MTITWLGQAGYLFLTDSGTRIMIDPYLSNSLEEQNGSDFHRQCPENDNFINTDIDVLILTHIHADHTDFATLDHLLNRSNSVCVLCPINTWHAVRDKYDSRHNYMQFDRGISITLNNVEISATLAAHSDERAIGVMLCADGKAVYHTGDTMFHRNIVNYIDRDIDLLLLPINGRGNNMNAVDAYRLACLINPKVVMPMHFDMFEKFGCDPSEFTSLFTDSNIKVSIPPYYTEVKI